MLIKRKHKQNKYQQRFKKHEDESSLSKISPYELLYAHNNRASNKQKPQGKFTEYQMQ